MSLVISLGSNLGERESFLNITKEKISAEFELVEESQVYESKAVDYENQPDFLNQVLVFKIPDLSPHECINFLLGVEAEIGRERDIPKGPRVIDIDILFWGTELIDSPDLQVPHPRLFTRSFIVLPLKELKVFNDLSKNFSFPDKFCNEAFPSKNV